MVAGPVLVVDLDGTLIRSDLLLESFWSALASDWLKSINSVFVLSKGRAALKQKLAQASRIEVAHLPYDPMVLAYIETWRSQGGQAALVTAADQSLADAVASHLGLFGEVHGSNGQRNLKAEAKADFLKARYGNRGFTYMGDSAADLSVWECANKAITVNASSGLCRRAGSVALDSEHLTTMARGIRPYLEALRPHQWLKNLLVFMPMAAAHKIEIGTALTSLSAFIAFCAVASSIYVMNDLLDLTADRTHPRKRYRPLASGRVKLMHGMAMAIGLLISGISIGVSVGWAFSGVLIGYYALSTVYSLKMKRFMVIDMCILAALYTIRIIAGSVATGIEPSVWFLAFSLFFFFSLAAVKRQAELVDNITRNSIKVSGRGYTVEDLPVITMIAVGSGFVSVLVLALYVNAPIVTTLYPHSEALWGICGVLLYWINRTILIAHRGKLHDDPVVYAARDGVSQICLIIVTMLVIVGAFK